MIHRTLILVALSILLAPREGAVSLPDRSVSPSRQFIIYGADTRLRGAISELAENTKANLLRLLRQRDVWKTPIIVHLQLPQADRPEIPPAALRFSQTGFGLKLQLDLTVAPDLDAARVERELARAIALEMIYRNQTNVAAGTPYVSPPDWLLDGVLALTPGRDRAPLLDALKLAAKVMPLEDFLRQRPELLDSPARVLYRACSWAFVQLLLDAPDGASRLSRYIDSLSRASNDPLADLKTQFPVLSDDPQHLWESRIASLRAARTYGLLSFTDSQEALDQAVGVAYTAASSPKRLKLEELVDRKPSPEERLALKSSSEQLLVLVGRAHPVIRPIVQEYYDVVARLAAGKRKRLAARLARLKTTRTNLVARMNDIDDYMNWFEATQQKSQSGVFVDYLRTAIKSAEPQPRRRDPLSVYLDALEQQFHN